MRQPEAVEIAGQPLAPYLTGPRGAAAGDRPVALNRTALG
jgi:hypothetical protein